MNIESSKDAIIFGATSSLSYSICHELASRGKNLTLVARNNEELSLLAKDIEIRHDVNISTIICDISEDKENIDNIISKCSHKDFDLVLITIGDMGNGNFDDINNIDSVIDINFTKPAMFVTKFAEKMQNNGNGTIAVISSVAGDRGRKSNYIYGSAKAGISAFCSGLRNRYSNTDLHVMTIKPGFVDTPMTYDMNSPLIASRDFVAKKIVDGIEKKTNILYVPFFWQYIMLIIKNTPERIFKKLNL